MDSTLDEYQKGFEHAIATVLAGVSGWQRDSSPEAANAANHIAAFARGITVPSGKTWSAPAAPQSNRPSDGEIPHDE